MHLGATIVLGIDDADVAGALPDLYATVEAGLFKLASIPKNASNNIIRFISKNFNLCFAKVLNKDEKWKKLRDHFFHFAIIIVERWYASG